MIFCHISFHKNHKKDSLHPKRSWIVRTSSNMSEHVKEMSHESWNISAIPHVNKGILPRGHNFHYNLGRLSEYQLTSQQQKCCMWFEYFVGQGVRWWNNVIWPIAYRIFCHHCSFPSFPCHWRKMSPSTATCGKARGFEKNVTIRFHAAEHVSILQIVSRLKRANCYTLTDPAC